MTENHSILGGKVHVYKRPESQIWQCSTYLAGKNRRVSTKESSLGKAKDFAEDWYLELCGKSRAGEIKNEKTFAAAASMFTAEYEILTGGERNQHYVENHQGRLRNYLNPFFGALGLSEITPGKVQEYRMARIDPEHKDKLSNQTFKQAVRLFERDCNFENVKRSRRALELRREWLNKQLLPYFGDRLVSVITAEAIEEYRQDRLADNASYDNVVDQEVGALNEVLRWIERRSKQPSRSTLHHEIVTLRQVLKVAARHGWLDGVPDLSMPFRASSKVTHRAWFSPEEYKRLYEKTRANARKAKGKRWQRSAEQLHDMVLFMANTGMRPDELNRLEYRDVTIIDDEDTGETILEIEARGKRGVGFCKSMPGAVIPFRRLLERNQPKSTDLLFPENHKKQFHKVLTELGLKFDRDGNRRTLYSLRHSYISFRLLEGADIYQVAKNCRTSVEMIEKHYAIHLKNSIDAAAVNVRRKTVR
ncbi:MAG: site-specific integrase [Gammaproteobacteria bacterium]|nr:site-specific integrase [Gammaproteobacteria bacterium]